MPTELVRQIDSALIDLDTAQAELARTTGEQGTLAERRAVHAQVRRAFDAADALLREATSEAKAHSYREWAHWRHRLSTLCTAQQQHLLSEQDDVGLLPLGCIQAVDTGMSGPAIGDLLHGQSKAPGTAAAYGLDLEAILIAGPTSVSRAAVPQDTPTPVPAEPPLESAAVVALSTPTTVARSAAA